MNSELSGVSHRSAGAEGDVTTASAPPLLGTVAKLQHPQVQLQWGRHSLPSQWVRCCRSSGFLGPGSCSAQVYRCCEVHPWQSVSCCILNALCEAGAVSSRGLQTSLHPNSGLSVLLKCLLCRNKSFSVFVKTFPGKIPGPVSV